MADIPMIEDDELPQGYVPDLASGRSTNPEQDTATIADDGSALIPESELDTAEPEMLEQEDGSLLVQDGDPAEDQKDKKGFYDNLAEELPPERRSAIAIELLDLIERDKESRKKRDEQYAQGIRRTGLGDEKPATAPFEGASDVVHPVLAEGCIDFASRAIKELLPPNGPVKTKIIGKKTEEALSRAERKRTFMNYQITGQGSRCIKEYRNQVEQLLTQLPLGGSQYLKIWHDDRYKRPRVEFIPVDDMFLPFAASSFDTSPRITHRQAVNEIEFNERVASGLYIDPMNRGTPSANLERSESADVAAAIEGKDESGFNEDGERIVFELEIDYFLEEDDEKRGDNLPAPYIITIDEVSRQVIGLYRNWDPKDDTFSRLDWIVEFPFIPWRGAYALGLAHVIGSLSGALTGSLRALLDSAHVNNFPGGIKLKGARVQGQAKTVEPMTLAEIEGPTNIDDIRKLAMPFPYNPPSEVLFKLMDWLTQQAKGVVSTAQEKIADAGNDMPVGTALALIEQGSANFSSIHARLHAAQAKVLAVLHRINAVYLEDEVVIAELGDLVVARKDFEGPMDIEPVSDPRTFSEAQRLGQFQAMVQLKADPDFKPMFNNAKLLRRGLATMNVTDYEDVLNLPPEPEKLDPITENTVTALGKQRIQVYPDQDHFAHLVTHLAFVTSPMFGANPLMQAAAMPLAEHCKEHLVYLYAQNMLAATKSAEIVAAQLQAPEANEQLIIRAVTVVEQNLAQRMGPHIMPMLQKLMQTMQQAQQQAAQAGPMDPARVTLMLGQGDLERQKQADAQKAQLQMAELQRKQQADRDAQQMEQIRLMLDKQRESYQQQIDAALEQMRTMSAERIANENNETKLLVAALQTKMSDLDRALDLFKHLNPPPATEPAGDGAAPPSGQE